MNRTGKRNMLRYIIGGDILMEDFVMKQSKLFLLIVFFIILFISNRYSCMKKLTEIEVLKEQLRDVKYENLALSIEVISKSRLSQIEQLLQSKGIELYAFKKSIFALRK